MNTKSAILAGFLIGIGGFAYLSVDSPEIGSALFSLGLMAVIVLGCNLYTGKVGYIEKSGEIKTLALMCLKNFIGSGFVGLFAGMQYFEKTSKICGVKLGQPLYMVFIKAFFCGVMIYLGVELYKKSKNTLLVVFSIMVFILCGFEHCVANVFYFAAARVFSVQAVILIVVCIIGNAAGSIAVRLLQKHEI